MGEKSGRKSDVLDLLMAEFERADLNWDNKGVPAECNIMVHEAAAHCFAVARALKACKVPTLEISDATRIKTGQLLNVVFASCCSRLLMNKIPAGCLLSNARCRSECRSDRFWLARSSTFLTCSPQQLAQIDSNFVSTLLLLSCLLCQAGRL